MRGRILTEAQAAEAVLMREEGKSVRAVAEHFGVSRSTMQNYLDPEMRAQRLEYSLAYGPAYYQKNKVARRKTQKAYRYRMAAGGN